jgi:hypothetical protein
VKVQMRAHFAYKPLRSTEPELIPVQESILNGLSFLAKLQFELNKMQLRENAVNVFCVILGYDSL